MKIGNNYKVAIAFTVLAFVISRLVSISIQDYVQFSFFFAAIISILLPSFGNLLHDTFSKIGVFLGRWISRIILFFVWIFAVLPTGILMKITKRDRLKLKKQNVSSYWIENTTKNTDYEYQF